ncbi:MAG: hypothetical protein M1822_001498 [Bathelium mastoideum]|nr:MAG: hypothetical protein M1822_001498 [Bathelium mastoideum]
MADEFLALSLGETTNFPDEHDKPNQTAEHSRSTRNNQPESEFQAIKTSYRPKIENGEPYKALTVLDFAQRANTRQVRKKDIDAIQAAVAELYFFKRYAEAVRILDEILADGCTIEGKNRDGLQRWAGRCKERLVEQAENNVQDLQRHDSDAGR